jgi:ribosomal protein S18 acetylase RimI-like enzyme
MQARAGELVVERLGAGDVVAFAQCAAIDATVFPHPSIPALEGAPAVWIARGQPGGAVSGFLAAIRRRGVLEIQGLAVSPGLRRRGVGRALLRAAIEDARTARLPGVLLQVATANQGAVALYESEGFVRVRRLPGYYARWLGGDAWAMRLAFR